MEAKPVVLTTASWLLIAAGVLGCLFGLFWILPDTVNIATGNGSYRWTLLYLVPSAVVLVALPVMVLRALVREEDPKRRFAIARWFLYLGLAEAFFGLVLWGLTAILIPGSLY